METKINWKMNDFKNRLEEKVTEERVASLMDES